MLFTIYKTTNLINGKIYIGAHKTEDPNDMYLGSGPVLKQAIQKYGIDKFAKEVLHTFDNAADMFAKEVEIVDEQFIIREDTYNIKVGGHGGKISQETKVKISKTKMGGTSPRKGVKLSDETRKKISEAKKNPSAETRKRMSDSAKKRPVSFKGKHHTDESKRKISEAKMGNQNRLGKRHSEETKRKISETKARRRAERLRAKEGN